ncbi:hypothetical protein F5Y15DRAFT_374477 [Xylariaceae sp. FL0016]|nr:hypothetical protein F5Y15DRAFT_374477 [Xylariaceae sp. FL0016]
MMPRQSFSSPSRFDSPKVRSSCDQCGLAKVKCDRARPRCRRCITLGIECAYGVSRLSGRPSQRTLRAKPMTDAVGSVPARESRRLWSPAGHVTWSNEGTSFGFPQPAATTMSSRIDTDGALNFCEHTQVDAGVFDFPLIADWPQPEGLDPYPQDLTSSGGSTSKADGRGQLQVENSANSHVKYTQGGYSCARKSYEILASLICPAPDLHAPDTNLDTVTAQMDQVLHFNRKAIDRLTQLLRCTCAKTGHRIVVHASIISRILMWYQQAAGWSCSSFSDARASSRVEMAADEPSSAALLTGSDAQLDGHATESRTLSQTTGFIVSHVPASMGTFGIEDQKMQMAIRNHLVSSELRKMSSLIDLFSSYCAEDSSVSSVAGLYVNTVAWIRSEYNMTLNGVRAKHRSLSEKSDT